MRFVVTGEWSKNRFLKTIVWCFLIYTADLWHSNAGLYFAKMSLDPASVVEYYRGDPERYLQPRSYVGLLETLHFHSFAMGILLMTLTHLMLFVPLSNATKAWGIATAFTAGLAGELSGWAVRYMHPGFAVAKVFFFLLLEGTLLYLMVVVARALLTSSSTAYTHGE